MAATTSASALLACSRRLPQTGRTLISNAADVLREICAFAAALPR